MSRLIAVLALLLWCLPLYAQDHFFYQKCYGSATLLVTNIPSTAGTVEVAVRHIIPQEGTAIDDLLAGRLVFRTVTPAINSSWLRTAVTVVMHDADTYAMENPYTATFSGPATAFLGWSRKGIKGTLKVVVSDRRDPTDELGPSIMQFDTIKMTFVPDTSPLPYQLEWEGIVWRGDLIVFERWVR
ncbi:MAG: hypothetical protein HPY54_04585 [Chthonomonadetes bacterium]|nr:hypothetical protein [Chthonomonadetes bacterium]